MKRTDKKTDTKKIASICGLSALSLAVLAGAYFLSREPTEEFVPSSIQTDTATDTWKENAGTDVQRPEDLPDGPIQAEGTADDQTQVLISEDDSGSTVSLSDSTARTDPEEGKPEQAPEGAVLDDEEEPDAQEEPAATESKAPAATPAPSVPSVEAEHAGQVYDPVFGWIPVGDTQQDIVDSNGDINKQIGTMGGG
ncbi:DUF6550 family protein [Lachnospiraceae bacterium 38-10]